MSKYKIEFKPRAVKDLEELPANDRVRVLAKIVTLGESPFPPGAEKLEVNDLWRVRVGETSG